MNKIFPKQLIIVSSDSKKFNVQYNDVVASHNNPFLSKFLQNMFNDTIFVVIDNTTTINLPIINGDSLKSDVMEVIFEHCRLQSLNPPGTVETNNDEIFQSMVNHCEYHLQSAHEHFDEELDRCKYNIFPIPQTFWYILKDVLYPKFIEKYQQLNNKDKIEKIWKHLMKIHDNGFCCHEDENYNDNNGCGRLLHEIPEWDRKLLEKYMDELTNKKWEECFLARIFVAAQFLDLSQLTEDISHLFGEYLSALSIDKMRYFFGEPDDLTHEEKENLDNLLLCINTDPIDVNIYKKMKK
jgi:hypothetical protein